jgi:hypothetical protein
MSTGARLGSQISELMRTAPASPERHPASDDRLIAEVSLPPSGTK